MRSVCEQCPTSRPDFPTSWATSRTTPPRSPRYSKPRVTRPSAPASGTWPPWNSVRQPGRSSSGRWGADLTGSTDFSRVKPISSIPNWSATTTRSSHPARLRTAITSVRTWSTSCCGWCLTARESDPTAHSSHTCPSVPPTLPTRLHPSTWRSTGARSTRVGTLFDSDGSSVKST